MTRRPFTAARWPNETEALLVRSILRGDDEAIDAWEAWAAIVDLDDIQAPSYDLLPLVHAKQRALGYSHADSPRLAGIHRRAWVRNQVLLRAGAGAASALTRAGIPVLALKGAVLLDRYYGDPGLRPMNDIDLLVPTGDAVRAAAVLTDDGWERANTQGVSLEAMVRVLHGVSFRRGEGEEIDLHWHVLEECCRPGDDAGFWRSAHDFDFRGTDIHALSPEDLLINVCVHGARGYPGRVVRWVVDAARILECEGAGFNWDRVVAHSRQMAVSLAMSNCLAYLRELHLAIPDDAVRRLEATRTGRVERFEEHVQDAPVTLPWAVARDLTRYARLSRGRSVFERGAGLPVYLQDLWGLAHWWSAPAEGGRRVWRRARETRFNLRKPLAPD